MIRLISAYERRLRRMAERVPASRRIGAYYAAVFPWCVLILATYVAIQVLGGSRQLEGFLFLPVGALAAAGACYAGSRVVAYGWQFDRTPPPAPWTKTENGSLLIQAFRRVTLNGLSSVTPETWVRRDLGLTSEDLSELVAVLGLRPKGEIDLTVQALLDEMNTSEPKGDAP
jgi:hypothetical protein